MRVSDVVAQVIGRRWFSYSYFVRQAPIQKRQGFSAVSRGRMDVAALVAEYNLRVLYDDEQAAPGVLEVKGLQTRDVMFQEVPGEETWVQVGQGTLGRSEFGPLLWLYGALNSWVRPGRQEMVEISMEELERELPSRYRATVLEGLPLFGIEVESGRFQVELKVHAGLVRSVSYTLVGVGQAGTDDRFGLELRPAERFDVDLPSDVASYPDMADFRTHAQSWYRPQLED